MNDHFRAYFKASNDPFWNDVVAAIAKTVETLQTKFAPMTGLVPDFIVKTNVAPEPGAPDYLEAATDGEYGYNSCRVPWRLATDYVVTGDAATKTQLQRINTFIKMTTGGDRPREIQDGYKLPTAPAAANVSSNGYLSFTAPFERSWRSSTPATRPRLDAVWREVVSKPVDVYFGDTIKGSVQHLIRGVRKLVGAVAEPGGEHGAGDREDRRPLTRRADATASPQRERRRIFTSPSGGEVAAVCGGG